MIASAKKGDKLTYKQIANGTGISIQMLCDYMKKRRRPTLHNALKLAKFLDLGLDSFMDYVEVKK